MKIVPRVFLQSTLLWALVVGCLVPDADASSVNTTYGGTVNPPSPGITLPANVQANNAITGGFSYNPLQHGVNGVYTFTGTGPAQSFSFSIQTGGTPALFSDAFPGGSALYTITIKDTGTKGATMDIHAAMTGGTSGPAKPNAFVDLLLTSTTYTGLALPANQTALQSAFLSAPGHLVWDPPAVTPFDSTGTIGFSATIDIFNGQVVPEPSSMVLAIAAMATCTVGILTCRRKAAAVSQRGQVAR